MHLSKSQWISVAICTVLFLLIYFGFDTSSKEQKALVKSRAQNLEILNIDRVINASKSKLSNTILIGIENLEDSLRVTDNDSVKLELLESLASAWYKSSEPLVSGYYAKKIAELKNEDAEAWAISGTTFAIAAKRLEDENEKTFAIEQSRQSFESAVSVNAEDISSRINLALSYVDFPEEGNPMKGILMLLDLNRQYPDNTQVLLQLGRLALGTNQLDKAVERLTRLLEIEPDNKQAHCLLAEAYTKLGKSQKAKKEIEICNS